MFMYNLYTYVVYDNIKIPQFHCAIEPALAECWWRFHKWIENDWSKAKESWSWWTVSSTAMRDVTRTNFSGRSTPYLLIFSWKSTAQNMFQITNFRFPETIVRGETPCFTIKCETCFNPGFWCQLFPFEQQQMSFSIVIFFREFLSFTLKFQCSNAWWNWWNSTRLWSLRSSWC